MKIIGIGHRSGHGKDTLADFLVDEFQKACPGIYIKKLSWAWKLKEAAHQLYGHLGLRGPGFYDTLAGRMLRNVKLPKINLTPVEIWIKFGSHGVRDQVWDLTWVEWLKNDPETQAYDIIVGADTRFPVEIPYCDYTIKLKNPRVPHREGLSVDEELAEYKGWNMYMLNDGTLEDLRDKARVFAILYLKTLHPRQ